MALGKKQQRQNSQEVTLPQAAKNEGLSREIFDAAVKFATGSSANQLLGLVPLRLARGEAETEMEISPSFANSHGISHGGFVVAFADSTMGIAIRTLNLRVVTVEMNTNFLAPAKIKEKLRAVSRVIHEGRQLIVAEAEVYNENGKLVAKSRGTFYIVKRE